MQTQNIKKNLLGYVELLSKLSKTNRWNKVLQILPFRGGYRSTDFAEVNAKKYRLKIKYILTPKPGRNFFSAFSFAL